MKAKLLIIISMLVVYIGSAQSLVPLLPPATLPAIKTVAQKQADSVVRINATLATLQIQIRLAVIGIQKEIEHNRDGLTRDQVLSGLGADKASSLSQAQLDLILLANKYAPGTFPKP